jgi:hypothetical protein
MFGPGPVTPVIIKVVPPATPEVTVLDVLFSSLGLTGAILAGSVLVGGLLGLIFIWFSRRRASRLDGRGQDGAIVLNLGAPPDHPGA